MRHTILSTTLLVLAFGASAEEQRNADPQTQDAEDRQQYEETDYQQEQMQQGERTTRTNSLRQQAGETEETDTTGSAATVRQRTQGQQTGQQQQGESAQTARQTGTPSQAGQQPDVARAQFTEQVQDKEPVNEVSSFRAANDPLYFFTEVKDAEGQTITHRWIHDGEVMAEVPLQVNGPTWRTWSSKQLMPDWGGEWTVEVVDSQGNVIDEQTVTVEAQQQTQQVGYSPDEQGQQQGAQQGQSAQQDQAQQASQQQGQSAQQDQETTQQQDDGGLQLDEGWDTEDVSAEDEQEQDDTATDDQDW